MVDDILIHGRSQEEHDQRVLQVLERVSKAGLTLNPQKCQFSKDRVTFLGHVVDRTGIKPDPDKVRAIAEMQQPTNVSEARRFLGTVNQMSKFIPHMANITKPINELLRKDRAWVWDRQQEEAFELIKKILTTTPVLAAFDPELETIVSADASSYGLGAVLVQKQRDGTLKPVAYVSRSLTITEQKYAQIEKEALAFTWACERLQGYLAGLKFHIQTDHKPLVPLFSTKHLEQLPIRVQRFRLRMMRFDYTLSHLPGKELYTADMLSRAPVDKPSSHDDSLEVQVCAYVDFVVETFPASNQQIERIKEQQKADQTCQQVRQYCLSGWPSKRELPPNVKPYLSVSNELAIQNDLLLRGERIIIPSSLQAEMLNKVHAGHQGITKCRERARQAVWWPGLSSQLKEVVDNFRQCLKNRNPQAQPLIPSSLPLLPWQKLGTDLFEWKKNTYLLIIDYYSRYIEISRLSQLTAAQVVSHTKSIFARHGIPDVVVSDNGPQYSSETYRQFAKDYEFAHCTSSPYYPQGNGEAERAVRTVKDLLKKEDDPYKALLAYRSTPTELGYSPSELLFCRKLKSTVPLTNEQRLPKVPDRSKVSCKDEKLKGRQKQNFDAHRAAKEQPPLRIGDSVWIRDRSSEGVIAKEINPRSFEIESPSGNYRRNRSDLIRLPGDDNEEPTSGTNSEQSSSSSEELTQNTAERRTLRDRASINAPQRYEPTWD